MAPSLDVVMIYNYFRKYVAPSLFLHEEVMIKINYYFRKYVAPSLFLHEGLPGHHTQIASKIEFGSPAMFRRYMGMDVAYHQVLSF